MTSPRLAVRVLRRERTITLRPEGDLDLCAREALVAAFRRALRERPAQLRIDASRIGFVDVAGMRAVMECRRAARAAGARFALVHPSPAVRRMLLLLRLDDVAALAHH